jgi:hypothetical protein
MSFDFSRLFSSIGTVVLLRSESRRVRLCRVFEISSLDVRNGSVDVMLLTSGNDDSSSVRVESTRDRESDAFER